MYTPFLKEHEDDLIRIITESIQETFQTYFQMDVGFQNLPVSVGQQKDPVICEAIVHNANDIIKGAIVVSFEKDTLIKLTQIVYPPEIALEQSSLDGCAEEISNIVGTRVKNYLNDYDMNLHMEVPKVMGEYDTKNNFLHVSFSVINNALVIDLILKKCGQ